MRRTVAIAVAAVALAGAAAGGWWWLRGRGDDGLLRASGMLEATEVAVASEFGGRLAALEVREGQAVRRGSVLATFDTELLDHQIQTADTATRLHLERQRDRQTLRSPLDGRVLRTVFRPGELVPPGAPVVVVADLGELTAKVYLPEDRFGLVALGQPAIVSVDSYPQERFAAEVAAIDSRAEFTPRNVQTREDRVKSVYAVKLRVPNAELRLKPGMFADAAFARTRGETGETGGR